MQPHPQPCDFLLKFMFECHDLRTLVILPLKIAIDGKENLIKNRDTSGWINIPIDIGSLAQDFAMIAVYKELRKKYT